LHVGTLIHAPLDEQVGLTELDKAKPALHVQVPSEPRRSEFESVTTPFNILNAPQ
jgi:hypothetical protein